VVLNQAPSPQAGRQSWWKRALHLRDFHRVFEEEADAIGLKSFGNRARNGSLSRACLAIQPEDMLAVRIVYPFFYLSEELLSGVWMTSCILCIGVRVTYRIVRNQKTYLLRNL